MATTGPLTYDPVTKHLVCARCDAAVTGVLLPIKPRERPRAWPAASEVIVDVHVDGAATTLFPCGHPYETETYLFAQAVDQMPAER